LSKQKQQAIDNLFRFRRMLIERLGMIEVVEVMTLSVDPTDGTFYVSWGNGVPDQYKAQMKASFGAMFKELPDSALVANRPA